MASPLDYLRRAPLRRMFEAADAEWIDGGDTAIVANVAGPGRGGDLLLADLSSLPRIGFKGRGTIAAMKDRGVAVEGEANKAFPQSDGGLCLVLAPGEIILLSDPLAGDVTGAETKLAGMLASWKLEDEERTYPLLRRDSHSWFAISGNKSPEMLAKICGVDFRPQKFGNHSIAQTSIAKMSAIITRSDVGPHLSFHLLADSAAALYFWSCLMDAAHEFGHKVVGLNALQELSRNDQTRRSPVEA